MKKENKIKRKIVKYFNAELVCKCEDSKSFKMSFGDESVKVCEDCHGKVEFKGNSKGSGDWVANNGIAKREYEDELRKKYKGMIFSSPKWRESIMQNKLHKVQEFLKLMKKENIKDSVTRQQIIALEKKYNKKLKPLWLMKDKKFQLSSGVYKLERFKLIESHFRNKQSLPI